METLIQHNKRPVKCVGLCRMSWLYFSK